MQVSQRGPRGEKLPYCRPELEAKGTVAGLTQQIKEFGVSDGFYLLNGDDNPGLHTVS